MGRGRRKLGRSPCTTSWGSRKRRWQNIKAAWFVCDLARLGLYRGSKDAYGQRLELYPYACPECGGWHVATVVTHGDRIYQLAGLAALRDDLKIPQRAGK